MMSSEPRRVLRRGSRRRRMSAARAPETRGPRTRRATPTPRRGTSGPHSRAGVRVLHLRVGWYVGVAVMAGVDIIEWPLAIVMMLWHEIAHRTHNAALRDFAEGVQSGV